MDLLDDNQTVASLIFLYQTLKATTLNKYEDSVSNKRWALENIMTLLMDTNESDGEGEDDIFRISFQAPAQRNI